VLVVTDSDGVADPDEIGTLHEATSDYVALGVAGEPPIRLRAGATLRPAWAVTAREATAATWPAVVLVLPGEAAGSLSRALLRSAVTTARQHLSIVHGAGAALAWAVSRASRGRRRSQLPGLLKPG
jgi:ATP-dependent exoDNAse (exonuclease V) alpha subunit